MIRMVLCLVLLGTTGCASPELVIALRTELAPGNDFDRIVVTVDGAHRVELSATLDDDFSDPSYLTDYDDVAAGVSHRVVVELFQGSNAVGQSGVIVRFDRPLVVPVTVTFDCLPDQCPGSGDPPSAVECFAGACFEETCDPAEASCMAGECTSTEACVQVGGCVDVLCLRGACLQLPRNERCDRESQWCRPSDGRCVYREGFGPPGAPVVTAREDATAPQIVLSWTGVGSGRYEVELSPDMTFVSDTLSMTTDALMVSFPGLEPGRRYHARARSTDVDAPWSEVVSATTFIAGPTGLRIAVTYPGVTRPWPGPDWITPPEGMPGNWYYVQAEASAVCASGNVRFEFVGRYTRPATPYTSPWQGPFSYIENTDPPYGVVYSVRARCEGRDRNSEPTGPMSGCFTRGDPC